MINYKKKTITLKTENFLSEFPLFLLLQQNDFTVKDWYIFKKNIQELTNPFSTKAARNPNSIEEFTPNFSQPFKIFNVKNSVFKKVLVTSGVLQASQTVICQGPNFLLGCHSTQHLALIWNVIHSHSKLVFISCIYENQLLNHLDLQILLQTNTSIYSHLLCHLENKTGLCDVLQHNVTVYPLVFTQQKLVNTLFLMKKQKQLPL